MSWFNKSLLETTDLEERVSALEAHIFFFPLCPYDTAIDLLFAFANRMQAPWKMVSYSSSSIPMPGSKWMHSKDSQMGESRVAWRTHEVLGEPAPP